MAKREFILKEDHLTLLKHACVSNISCEFGAPGIDCKRPFGNSDVIGDMIDIMGIDAERDDDSWRYPEDVEGELMELYSELETALRVIFKNLPNVRLGKYVSEDYFGEEWAFVED